MLDGLVNDAVEAQAISLNPNHIDIYSASWGPEDDGKTVDGPGPLARKAFQSGIANGRNGLGSIFVWASGNGGRQIDNCNCDGYTNSIYTLSISSATQGGRKPWYLEECSSTVATTYSSGTPGHDASITTVDQDERLRPNYMCTSGHTGTSASAPLAAGVCALALQANAKLSWRDMQHIVIQTANPNPLLHEDGWAVNGIGRKFSHKFGYGLMDASAMVDVALNWPGVSEQRECLSNMMKPNITLSRIANDTKKVAVQMDGCKGQKAHAITVLEHVVCRVTLRHNPRGSVHLVLISPMGTRSSLLLPRPKDRSDKPFENWPFLSVHFWGEPPNGTWTLEVKQTSSKKPAGVLISWQLILYGTADLSPMAVPQDTDEDSDMLDTDDLLASVLENELQDINYPSFPLLPQQADEDGCHPECANGCRNALRPTSDMCYGCKHYNFSGYCVPTCPDGTYETPEKSCAPCSKACATCYGSLPTQCLSCSSPKLFLYSLSTCLQECPRGWKSNKEETECQPCPPSCANCDAKFACENCKLGYFLRTDTRTCVVACPEGYYHDRITKTCQPCHPDCEACIGPRDTQCARCRKGSFYYQRKCTKQGCPKGFFADLSIWECAPCPKGCQSCLGPDSCEVCEAGWTLVNSKICTPTLSKSKCPHDKMYFSNHTGQCAPCAADCGTCFDGSKDGCLSCAEKPLLHINSCIEGHCPDATFQYNNECRHCAHACARCSTLQKCDTCHTGYFLTDKGHCVPACPRNQYPDGGTCQPCPLACDTCLNATTCSSCPDKTPFLISDGSCLDRCPLGTYKDQARCLPCHGSCHSCSGPSKTDCLSCPGGTRLHDYTCQSCGHGYYYDNAGSSNCQKCHVTCSSCIGPAASDCLSCLEANLHLDENNTCVPCCSTSEIEDNCCKCDEKKAKCLSRNANDIEDYGQRSNKKRGLLAASNKESGYKVMDRFLLFATLLSLFTGAFMAYKKYYKRMKRMKKPSRAKWRRANHDYTKVNEHEIGCDYNMDSKEPGIAFDDEDDSEEDVHIFGEERRRLLLNEASTSPDNIVNT